MTRRKARLTVTVDRELVRAGNRSVAAGEADSLSGWVNLALTERVKREQRLRAMADAVAAYEAEFGEITAEEIALQERRDSRSAVVVRGSKLRSAEKRGRRRGAA
jgi:hypothetical protein